MVVMREFEEFEQANRILLPEKIQQAEGDDEAKRLVLSWFAYFSEEDDYDILTESISSYQCIHELYYDEKNNRIWVTRPLLPFFIAIIDINNGTYTLIDNNFGEEHDTVTELEKDVISFLNSFCQSLPGIS